MMSVMMATIKRNHRVYKRAYPGTFIIGRIIIGAYTALFAYFIYFYIFHNNLNSSFRSYTGSSDYMTFVILGASLHVFASSTMMSVGRCLMKELREGTLDVFLLSPASRKGYFIGIMLEQVGRSTLEFMTILIVGKLLGAKFANIQVLQVLIIWMLALLSFFSMSISLASLMLRTRDTYISQNTLFILMNFICGVSFPIQYLPNWLQTFAHIFPLTPLLQLFRSVVLSGQSISNHLGLIIETIILSLIYFISGLLWLLKVEKKYIENTFG